MSKQYPGGFITKSPTAPTASAAPGIWTLDQAMQYIKAGTWPGLPDAQFNYVTMLLHGDGTNAAQNNTFLDSSTNNFTITRYGNTTQGSFSPYGSNWSNYFNGSTDYLTTAGGMPSGQGTAFTMECWIYLANLTDYRTITRDPSGSNFDFGVSNTGVIQLYLGGGATLICASVSGTILANNWYHIAVTRTTGNAYTIYVNGTSVATGTNATSITANTIIGYNSYSAIYNFAGYISNFRVTNTLVYTTTFTPSTTPLTAISGTSLLICQSNRFIDNSSNAYAITTTGTPSVQRFNPFGTSTAYSTSVIGGSGYFDGTGDYLTAPSNAGFGFGTGDFTVEFWIYYPPLSNTNGKMVIDSRPDLTNGNYWNCGLSNSGILGFDTGSGGTTVLDTVARPNQWVHYAASRSGTSLKLFANGTQVASSTDSSNTVTSGVRIGQNAFYPYAPDTYWLGYISNLRIVKGTAVYTSNFTPSTTPLTAITNTQLLLSYINGAIFDNAMMNNLETVGNAQISTSVVKYGTGSLAFDGAGDYLVSPYNPNQEFGSGNLTWEMWINTTNSVQYATLYAKTPASFATGMWSLMMNMASSTTGDVGVYMADYSTSTPLLQTTGVSVRDGAWHHIAVVRNGSSWVLYVDGTSRATQTWSGTIAVLSTGGPYIGKDQFYGRDYNGYIDDLRITKGYARYTANFTPPTAAFQNTGPV